MGIQMGKPKNTGASMNIYKFTIFDPNAGEMEMGYFATVQLAINKKKQIEQERRHILDKSEYAFQKIKVQLLPGAPSKES